MIHRRRAILHRTGFTLIEMVVALSILAMVAILMASAVRLATGAWDRSQIKAAGLDAVMTAQSALRKRVQQIYPPQAAKDARQPRYAVVGSARELVFTSNSPSGAGAGAGAAERYRYHAYLKQQEKAKDLVIAWRPDRSGISDQGNPVQENSESILGDVDDIAFEFFGPAGATGEGRWQTEWHDAATAPRLIRLRVQFKPADARQWPDFVVRPRVTAGAICAFDAVSRACR